MRERSKWLFESNITFLNHGSFGACPKIVLEAQDSWRHQLEAEPVTFFMREYEAALERARESLASLVGAEGSDLVFVSNATTAVNAVLRSLSFMPGDEILVTNHIYNACGNAVRFVAERSGANVVVANLPFPLRDKQEVIESVTRAVTPRTCLALLDHVTSDTGLVLPIESLVRRLEKAGVPVLVDGAHAPGMLPLDLESLAPAFYTGNCHKWLCAPKGAAFLWVRQDLQSQIRPLAISHGANSVRTDRSRFLIEFDWTGTRDPSPWLTVPAAIDFVSSLDENGLPGLQQRNRNLAIKARQLLAAELGLEDPCPDEMIGSLAALPLPDAADGQIVQNMEVDSLQERLFREFHIEVPVMCWPQPPKRLLRISAHFYNEMADYKYLAKALSELLG